MSSQQSSTSHPKVRLSQKGASRIESGHPWIFASDVTDTGGAAPGQAVTVTGPRGQILGTAHYSSTSQISLRMLSREVIAVDQAFLARRIAAARAHRRRVVPADATGWRLIHAEGDLLPGLIADYYAGHLSVQFLDQGMDAAAPQIVEALRAEFGDELQSIVARNDAGARQHEGLPLERKLIWGECPAAVEIRMNGGLTFQADLLGGQKTGSYLDQRENYAAVASYVTPQMRVLDCFTSSGGFAVHCARAGARVEAIDSSAGALATARTNAAANGLSQAVEFREADVLKLLPALQASRRKYDMVVLDPPAFAKSRSAVAGAVRGYRDINLRALNLIEPGGILVSCSCSHHVPEALLLEAVAEAALAIGRGLRVLERRFQGQDHPVLLTVPETLYLKCLILQVLPRPTDSL